MKQISSPPERECHGKTTVFLFLFIRSVFVLFNSSNIQRLKNPHIVFVIEHLEYDIVNHDHILSDRYVYHREPKRGSRKKKDGI